MRLESRTMDVLVCLAARAGDVVSVEELRAAVWQGVVVSDSSVYQAIKQLRQALAGTGDDTGYIETIPKRGYRLVAPVEPLHSDAAAVETPTPPAQITAMETEAPNRTRRFWFAAALLTLGVLLGGTLLRAWWHGPGSAESSRTGAQVDSAQPTFRFEIPVDVTTGIAVSRDGRHVAYAAGSTLDTTTLHVRALDSTEVRQLTGTEGAWFPFWSPDGEHLGFSVPGRIKRVARAGGSPQELARTPVKVRSSGSWSSDGVVLFDGGTGLERVSASGGEPTTATTLDIQGGEVAHAGPWFLPDGHQFLFVSVFGRPGVYVGTSDSGKRKQILPFACAAIYASGHLLFNRGAKLFAQRFDPQSLTLLGEPIQIADGLFTDPSGTVALFSASDTGVLAYAVGGPARDEPPTRASRLTWYERSGKRLDSIGEPGLYRGIELSPNGRYVAVHRHEDPGGGNLWLYDLERGTFSRLTFERGHDVWPVWSPDGSFVLFTGAQFHLNQKRSNGTGEEELVLSSLRIPFASDWSADGTTVLLTHSPSRDADVSALRLDRGRTLVPLLNTRFNEVGGTLSPDGRQLAYASDESGRFEVYTRSYPGLADKERVSTDGGVMPRWSRDGKELFFLTQDGTLMAASLNSRDGAQRLERPRALFKADLVFGDHATTIGDLAHMPYDVSADGQRFLINERVSNAPSASMSPQNVTIIVVVNWTAALQ